MRDPNSTRVGDKRRLKAIQRLVGKLPQGFRIWAFVGKTALVILVVGALIAHAVEAWDVRVDGISLGLFVLLILVAVGLDRIQEIGGPGGVSVKLRPDEARTAAKSLAVKTEDEAPADVSDLPISEELIRMAEKLRGWLSEIHSYFWDELCPNELYGSPDAHYVLAELRTSNLLTQQEASVLARVLQLASEAMLGRQLPEEQIQPSMRHVATALTNVRATVFKRMAQKECKDAGWIVSDSINGAPATDFLTTTTKGDCQRIIVAALSVKARGASWLEGTIKRMTASSRDSEEYKRLIVIPPRSKTGDEVLGKFERKPEDEPRVVPPRVVPINRLRDELNAYGLRRENSQSGS